MRHKVRNADWHLWALHSLNRYEKHDSGFCTIPYCCRGAKPASFKLKTRVNLLLALGFRAASTKNKRAPYRPAVLGVYNLQDKPFKR